MQHPSPFPCRERYHYAKRASEPSWCTTAGGVADLMEGEGEKEVDGDVEGAYVHRQPRYDDTPSPTSPFFHPG